MCHLDKNIWPWYICAHFMQVYVIDYLLFTIPGLISQLRTYNLQAFSLIPLGVAGVPINKVSGN